MTRRPDGPREPPGNDGPASGTETGGGIRAAACAVLRAQRRTGRRAGYVAGS